MRKNYGPRSGVRCGNRMGSAEEQTSGRAVDPSAVLDFKVFTAGLADLEWPSIVSRYW